MGFGANSLKIAEKEMMEVNPALSGKYKTIIEFLSIYPDSVSWRGKDKSKIGDTDYLKRQARAFAAGREPRVPQTPETVPDEIVSMILRDHYGIQPSHLERAKREHLKAMSAENLVGFLLESYLASVLEQRGWVWCSGDLVKAIDFLKPPSAQSRTWVLLQIKNRDNSENSSSSAVRHGTEIQKWFRTFAKTGNTNWESFPDADCRGFLSEDGFKNFVERYLAAMARK